MTKNRPFNGRVISSVVLLQQLALSSPAMANPVHGAVGGPWQNLSHHSSAPVIPLAGGTSAGFLPATFGHGVSQLPLAHQTLPLNQFAATHSFIPGVHQLPSFSTVKLSPLQNIQLDLTSADTSILLGTQTVKSGHDVSVEVGGTATIFHAGEKVTAAELVAVEQAQTKSGQTITLNSDGVAVGGSFSLNGVTSPSTGVAVTGVVVPGNVTAIDKVAAHSSVNLSGDLVNYGSIVEVGKGNASANLSALDIVNEAGASISTVSHGAKGIDLNLTAADSLTNSGTITSAGSLSLNAPQITNSGTVTATTGAVTLTSGQGVNLNVNNAGGIITAASAINIREAGYAGSGTTSVTGGDLISQQVNINAGQAIANVNVNKLTGEVVSVGEGVHVSANTDTLVLGKQCLTGDPTFYNTGNIIINGNLSAAEDLSIIAEGSVFGTSSLTSITVNDGNSGKDLTIIAGANISGSTGSTNPNLPIAPGPNTATIDLGSSVFGGNIDFTASSSLAISTNAPSATHNGGNIVLAAYEGPGGVGGAVVLPTTTTITAFGNGGGSINGDVTILARAPQAGTVISVGTISGARNVIVANFGLTSSDGKPVTFAADGSISSSNTLAPAYGGSSNLGDVNISQINATGNVTLFAGGTLNLTGPVFGPGTTIATANGDVNIAVGVGGGNGVLIGAGGNVTATSATSITAHNSLGPANIIISAGAALQVSSGLVIFVGPSNTGGNVNLSAVTAINTSATTGNNSGGSITIGATAFNGGTGKIDIGGAALTTGGIGSGGGGDVTLTAALTGGVAIVMPASIIFGGGSASSGSLNLHTAQPLNPNAAVDTTTITFTPGGDFSGGQTTAGSIDTGTSSQVNLAGGALSYNIGGNIIGTSGSITGLASTVTISAGAINLPFIGVSKATLTVSASGDLTGTNTVTANSAFISAGGLVSLSDITAPQQITVIAGNGLSVGAVSSNSTTGDAGPVTLISGAQFSTTPGSSVTISGANIGLLFDLSFKSINATSTVGNGGNVIISAFSGDGSSGTISATNVSGISTSGNSSFKNGDVIINSANSSIAFSAIVPLNINTLNSKTSGDITVTNTANDLPINIVIDTSKGLVTTGSLEGSTNAGGTATFGALLAGGNVKVLAGPVTLTGPVGGGGSLVTVDSTGDINLISGGSSTSQSVSFAAKGSINLSGSLNEFAGISLVAGQNISTLTNGLSLKTSSATSTGDITLVAGAAFSTTDTNITVTGPSGSGGNIDLALHPLANLSTSAPFNSGAVNLIAFADSKGSTGGQVSSTTGITSGSTGSGTNGDVVIVAGSNTAAIVGPVTVFTQGGGSSVAGTGNVTLAAATPNASAGSPINITRIGAAPSASFVGGAATTGSVAFNMIGTHQATVTIEDGTALTISSPAPTAANLILQSLDNVTISTALSNNSVAIFAGKSIQIGASITSPGGIALIANQDITTTVAGLTISTASGSGTAGALTIIAGANFNTSLTGATVNGGSLTGGQINLSNLTTFSASSAGGGDGGNISLATFTGSNKLSDISLPIAGNMLATAVAGTGGSITIVGGGTSSVTLGQVTTNDSTITIENATPQTVTVANNGTVTGFLNPSSGFTAGTINATTISSTGGRITVETGGNLKINSIDASNSNAFGGTVTIVSGSTSNNLQIGTVIGLNYVGAVNTSGSFSVGGAGSLDIESTGGAGLTFANASNIQFAGSTLISAPSLTFVATGSTLDLGTFQGGNISVTSVTGAGGGVTLIADKITYATIATAPLTIDASGLTSSGTIFLQLGGSTPLAIANKAGDFVLTSKGGTVIFIAGNAPLSVDGSAISVSTLNNGGRIDLRADGFSGAATIVLNASANTTSGSINISDLSTTETLTIGGGNGQFTLNAKGTSGGTITVDGQAIVVNPLNIAAAPTSSNGQGADLEFYSNSTLVVNGALSADGGASGNGGTIILQANSPTTFTTGASGKIVNGVGALSAAGAGGQIKIINNAGSIINSGAITKFALLDEQVSGAKSVITINNTLGVDNTSEIDLGSDAGAISSAKAITTGVFDAESTSGAITFSKLNATDITALSGNTKTSNVTITNVGIGTTNINLLQGNNISFKSAGNITASKSIDASGTVAVSTTAKTGATIDLNDVTALSTVTVSSTGSMSFGHVDGTKGVKFSNKDVGASIDLNDNVGSTAGTISITAPGAITSAAGFDMSAAKGVTLTSSKGAITIATVGVVDATSALTATAFTSVTTLDTVSATTTITLKATDKTAGSGLVNIQGQMTVASTKGSLTMTAGAAGLVNDASAADGTKVSAGKITVTAPGGATFNHLNMNTTGSTLAITAAKGGVTIGSNASLGSFSTVTLTGLTDVTNDGHITGATGVTASSKGIDGKTGTLTNDGTITASNSTAKVTLTTTGNLQQNGTITSGSDVNLKASVGSMSTNASSTTTSTNGKVILAALHTIDDLGSLAAKTNISVTTTAKLQADTLTVGHLNTSEGNISVIGAGGSVNTTSGATITADSNLTKTKATLLIEDSNVSKGITSTISIDGTLSTHGPGGGNVSISIGAPGTGKNPVTTLPGFTIDTSKGGTVFAGATPTALVVTGVGKAMLTTQGKNIILTSPSASQTITFTDTSSVTADPPVNGTGVANAVSNVAAPIRIMPVIEPAPIAPTSSNNIIKVDTVPIASAASDSTSLNASIANSRTISGGVSYIDEWPISGFSSSSINSTGQSYNQTYKWISPTEVDGGAIPAVFIGQGNSSAQTTLPSGTALVSPAQDMTIETPYGKVFVAARALAIVMALPNGLAVYNLHDRKSDSVGLERNGKRVHIAPASAMIFVADKRFGFADINPAQLVCYGKLNETLDGNGKCFSAEFSLPSAINAMPMLKNLITSNDKQTTRIAGDFLKTVAIMQTLSGANYQNFSQHIRPVMTACK